MRLLVVEDEPKMARMLQRGLAEEGHQVDVCASGSDAEAQARAVAYDAIVLDWSLPDADGVSVLRSLRASGYTTPVLMLTARGTVGERVTGLRAGADDYLVKPFDFEELLARLEALQRRTGSQAVSQRFQSAQLDARRRTLLGPAGESSLTAREFALASELFARPGDVLTRNHLLNSAWGNDFERTYNVVDVYVGYLRAKLLEVGAHDVAIVAVRGMGYRMTARGRP
ncbi:MAG: transcriptional regulator [Myxococcaceae bacterium]|nr:transcriptional regulator [Myxococcaceae bacterium]